MSDKKVIISGEANLPEAWINEDEFLRDVFEQQPPLPALFYFEVGAGREPDQVYVIDLAENILCLVEAALEVPLCKVSRGGNTNPGVLAQFRRPCVWNVIIIPWTSLPTAGLPLGTWIQPLALSRDLPVGSQSSLFHC